MDKNITDPEILEHIAQAANASATNQENEELFNLLDEEK